MRNLTEERLTREKFKLGDEYLKLKDPDMQFFAREVFRFNRIVKVSSLSPEQKEKLIFKPEDYEALDKIRKITNQYQRGPEIAKWRRLNNSPQVEAKAENRSEKLPESSPPSLAGFRPPQASATPTLRGDSKVYPIERYEDVKAFSIIRTELLNCTTGTKRAMAEANRQGKIMSALDEIHSKLSNNKYASPTDALREIFASVAHESTNSRLADKSPVVATLNSFIKNSDLKDYVITALNSKPPKTALLNTFDSIGQQIAMTDGLKKCSEFNKSVRGVVAPQGNQVVAKITAKG